MTLEDRFQVLAADFVCAFQDLQALKHHAAEMNELCEKNGGVVEEARAIIIAMMSCAATEPGLDAALAERANDWLKEA